MYNLAKIDQSRRESLAQTSREKLAAVVDENNRLTLRLRLG